jgi:hypothetical protein
MQMTTQGSGTDHGFNNPTTQEQRARILREADRANTLAAQQAMLEPSLGGRFAKEARHDFTVGRDARVEYPRLPPSSPWAQQQPGLEPPFPEDINFVEACGTQAEIERSIAAVAEPVGPTPADSHAEVLSPPSAIAGPSPLLADQQPAPLTAPASVTSGREVGGAALSSRGSITRRFG